jgi:outer membrane protein assembly factor BamE (lipoprotein component of BamABCDE complex)
MPKPKTTRTASVHAMACATLLSIGALTACTPGIDRRGFVPDETDTQPIQSGVDTKSTVLARYGTPSTVAAFDDNSWYYISDTKERRTYHLPTTTQRTVLAIKFGQNDVVDGVKTYGMKDGRVVNYSDRATPTRGRELSVVEQIFGNVGRTALPNSDNEIGSRR